MKTSQILKSTQQQAIASWTDHLNSIRLQELISNLMSQDENLINSLEELKQLKNFVANPGNILGSPISKHGEIAEHVHVNISNARKLIEGLTPDYTFENVMRFAPEDYLFNGVKVQSKYLNSLVRTLTSQEGVLGHLTKYPDFTKEGGIYHIPKDQYESMKKLLSMSEEEVNKATREVRAVVSKLNAFQNQTGIDLSDKTVQPAIGNYANVQLEKIKETINSEEKSINKKDKINREKSYQNSRPSLQQGLNVTAVSASLEGGIGFCLEVHKKIKSGKKIPDFTTSDWKDVGLEGAIGSGKGAVRGASIYGMTNFSATPAAVASALVTATFGMASQASLLHHGKISNEDFIINSEVICLDVTFSAISSLMGQVMIPIPILGAIIGNTTGMFMYGIAKNNLSKNEQLLIDSYMLDIKQINMKLNTNYSEYIDYLAKELNNFKSIIDLALSPEVNIAFESSILLGQYNDCDSDSILKSKQDIDNYFLL